MRICVYTALIGQYDGLIEQSVAAQSTADFICFTDDPDLTSETWEIRRVKRAFGQDPVRSARLLKILGDDSLDEYDVTLYIDASVLLRRVPEQVVEDWLTDGDDIALSTHGYREQLLDEFDEVVRLQYDDRSRVYEQLVDYSLDCPEVLESRPLWTGILVRRRNPAVAATMRVWANHVLRYSRRDQLSVLAALRSGDASVRVLQVDNFDSPDHQWPVIPQRRVRQGKAPALPTGPLLAELRRAVRQVEELTVDFNGRTARDVIDSERSERARADGAQMRIEAVTRELAMTASELKQTTGILGATRNLGRAIARKFGSTS
ncbi:glycosyltransferase domain-containing protein [Microbacterium allomyrinae]|uniref:DUF616 domain-containing protein n=1 Tax=Microbacterium allomyrinae TaxID=2830666 RepID=A0A9X1S4S0_9MICO|nr:glycosyltransferase domain-containing protein [Microbacterium allomyrinae]MCC2033418.1 DUF616 domain-containing protein [Microbacterium allomyrinae]